MASNETEQQIEKLIQRLLYENDPVERSNLSNILFARFTGIGLHPTDIKIHLNGAPGDFPLTEQLRRQLNEQYNELNFLRGHVDPLILRGAIKARMIAWRWPEFKELIRSRVTGDDPESGKLAAGWKTRLAQILNLNASIFAEWEDGTKQIPDWAFDRLRELSDLSPRSSVISDSDHHSTQKERKKHGRSDNFPWTPEKYQECLRMRQNREGGKEAILKYLGISREKYGPVDRKLTNDAPDEPLLGFEIQVLDGDGPMTFLELWKVGHAIWAAESKKATWKGYIASRYGKDRNAIRWDEPTWLSPSQRDALRREYRQIKISEPNPQFDISQAKQLWDEDIAVAAMRLFVVAHFQKELSELDVHKQNILSERLAREVLYRKESKRYLHLSRGLALFPKRQERQPRGSENKSDLSAEEFRNIAITLFGQPPKENRLVRYIAQLYGYDHTVTRDIFSGDRSRAVMKPVYQFYETIIALVEGLDLDDPSSEKEIMKRVQAAN